MNLYPYTLSQRSAICHEQGPMFVSAGPGSGKTTVIIAHVLYLIQEKGVHPDNILTVTFTRAAARQMEERYIQIAGFSESLPRFGTIHSVFYEILRRESTSGHIHLISESDRNAFWKDHLYRLSELSEATCMPSTQDELLKEILMQISRKINTSSRWEDIRIPGIPSSELARIYQHYQEYKKQSGVFDYDDILIRTVQILQENPDILSRWQRLYPYILVDEFQDVNRLQYEGLQLLSGYRQNLYVVGDDDQSIYGFRGSSPDIMKQFRKDHPGHRLVVLDQSHRAPDILLAPARNLIRHNRERIAKNISGSPDPEDAGWNLTSYKDQTEEYAAIASYAKEYAGNGIPLSAQAILLRSSRNMSQLKAALRDSGIPFHSSGHRDTFSEHFIAKDVMACLKFAAGTAQRDDLFVLLAVFCSHIPRYMIRELPTEPISPPVYIVLQELQKQLKEPQALKELLQLVRHLAFLKSLSPFAALEYLLKAMGYESYLRKRSYEWTGKPDTYQPIVEQIRQNARKFSLHKDFLNYLNQTDKSISVTVPEKDISDGMNILTMHSSKGLEFDIVYIPDLNKGILPIARISRPSSESSASSETEEERRLLYVAMTRAKRRLHLSYVEYIRGKKVFPSEFLAQLQ